MFKQKYAKKDVALRPRLLNFVLSLDEDVVVYASQKAFESLPNVSKSISELTALKGMSEKAARIDVEADALTGIGIVKKCGTEITIITQTEHAHERVKAGNRTSLMYSMADAKGNTTSHMAARKVHVQGNTGLHMATRKDRVQVFLISHGRDTLMVLLLETLQ
ncbi:hypothetical protein Tco_0311591 [Tanacetum coccineum]